MKVTLVMALAPGGVMAASMKPCDGFAGNSDGETFPCEGGVIHARSSRHSFSGERLTCGTCHGKGRVPTNSTPWSYPEWDQRVETLSRGAIVVFDQVAFAALPVPWVWPSPRTTIVVTPRSRGLLENAEYADWVVPDFGRALNIAFANRVDVFVVARRPGLYVEAMPYADHLDVTLIGPTYEGDVRFPGGASFFNSDRVLRTDAAGTTDWKITCIASGGDPLARASYDLKYTTWERVR